MIRMPFSPRAALLLGAAFALIAATAPPAPQAATRGTFLNAGGEAATAPEGRWWLALNDATLNDLETRALAGSPDIAIAGARIAAARANLAAGKAALLPTASLGGTFAEADLPGAVLGASGRVSQQLYADNLQASWEADVFGVNKNRNAAAAARADAAIATAADARVALTAEVAQVYASLRSQQADAALAERIAALDEALVGHARNRLEGGTGSAQALDAANSALANARADLATKRAAIGILADQLAVLTGAEPGALNDLLHTPGPVPQVPAQIAVGDPARLIAQRPDVRAALAQAGASRADLKAREADRLPHISFTGILGLGGAGVSDALNPSSLIALALPQIRWTLFDGGRARAGINAAGAARDEAEAQYRKAVLGALEDAEASLARFGAQRIALARAAEARAAADHAATLQAGRVAGGTLPQSEAIVAERQALAARSAELAAATQLTAGFIAVEKALGLGWSEK